MASDQKKTLQDQIARYQRLVDELEDLMSAGFFISLFDKVIMDEKKLAHVISRLRSLDFDAESRAVAPRKLELPDDASDLVKRAYADAENIRRGADEYALDVLSGLDHRMEKYLTSIREGRKVLIERLENK